MAGGIVYVVREYDDTLSAFDEHTGAVLWQVPLGESTFTYTAPAVANGIVYAADGGRLHALDAAIGDPLWTFQGGGDYSSPAVSGGVIYIGSTTNGVFALDAITGAQIWHTILFCPCGTPAVANGLVYFGTEFGGADALDAATGDVVWNAASRPRVRGKRAGCQQRARLFQHGHCGSLCAVVAFDASTGAARWTFKTPYGIWATGDFAVEGGLVYAEAHDNLTNSGNGALYALDAATGARLGRRAMSLMAALPWGRPPPTGRLRGREQHLRGCDRQCHRSSERRSAVAVRRSRWRLFHLSRHGRWDALRRRRLPGRAVRLRLARLVARAGGGGPVQT